MKENWLLEMSNVRGKDCKVEVIDFSFYFSTKERVPHSIRVKVKWNPNRMSGSDDGYFELHGDYKYVSESRDSVNFKQIEKARQFFKKYKVVFSGVWEDIIDPTDAVHYFEGRIGLIDLIEEMSLSDEEIYDTLRLMRGVESDISELETAVRVLSLFNMND